MAVTQKFLQTHGQGIDRLYAATLQLKVPPPIFLNNDNYFIIKLSAPKSFEEFSPEEKHLLVTILVVMQGTVDNESIRNCFDINAGKATTLIQSMISERILQAGSRSRKFAKYTLTANYHEKIFG